MRRPLLFSVASITLEPMLKGMFVIVLAAVVLIAAVPASGSPVAPRNCGMMNVEGKRYQVKADQIRCSTAKTRTRRYLREGDRPSGYKCRNYGSGTALKFRCWKRQRVFFAIKR
jgi:hypothetical protein